MPLEQPSDYPKAALQAHNSLSAPTHFSPVPDTPESQVDPDLASPKVASSGVSASIHFLGDVCGPVGSL